MKLEDSWNILANEVQFEEIFFVSDIEIFTKEIKKYLLERIKQDKIKLVVFAGDILSFLEKDVGPLKIYDDSYSAFKLFYDTDQFLKDNKLEESDLFNASKYVVGEKISELIVKDHKDELDHFFSFVKTCKRKKVEIIFFSGNHDSMLSYNNYFFDADYIPIFKKIKKLSNFHIPYDLQLIELNENLFLLGIHTNFNTDRCSEYPELERLTNSLEEIEGAKEIIFVSHVPGVSKFSKLGSKDITNFKKRFKFKYHFHGHCKNYHGEYVEEGIPTKSVHFDHPELEDEETSSKSPDNPYQSTLMLF